ncbi:MAG: YceI family protein [Planctomycetaceae bacterium]
MTVRGVAAGFLVRCGAVVFVALVTAGAAASGQQPAAPGAVDLAGSRVYVFVGKTGLGHDHAVTGALQAGRLRLGAAEQAGTLVFDMRSFRADGPEARRTLGLAGETDPDTRRQVDENMLGPAVLDVAKHPTATFEIRSALPSPQQPGNGKAAYDLVGTFTLHGVARPATIRAEAGAAGQLVRLWGGFTIRQTDHGIKPFAKLGGVVGVANELKIYGDIRVAAGAAP